MWVRVSAHREQSATVLVCVGGSWGRAVPRGPGAQNTAHIVRAAPRPGTGTRPQHGGLELRWGHERAYLGMLRMATLPDVFSCFRRRLDPKRPLQRGR